MSSTTCDDLSGFSMQELFRAETDAQKAVLTDGLLGLEREPTNAARLEALMRAAHSLKGAARIVDLNAAVRVAHVMEDCFVAAQQGRITLQRAHVDALLCGVDLLNRIAEAPDAGTQNGNNGLDADVEDFVVQLELVMSGTGLTPTCANVVTSSPELVEDSTEHSQLIAIESSVPVPARSASEDRFLRVNADTLNRLLALAGESLVDSRRLRPFTDKMLRLKRQQIEAMQVFDGLREELGALDLGEQTLNRLAEVQHKMIECRRSLAERLAELELFDRRSVNLSHRLYGEALACRMRPFSDGIQGFARMVRDVARSLGKEVRLEVVGEGTQVDREILDRLEGPLTHLLRNAVDHGIEFPGQRAGARKPTEGTLLLEARHSAGMLMISVSDDGSGIDLDRLRQTIVRKGLTTADTAAKMSEAELLEFLFLPGFSMKDTVTEISGRGVGLDVVQNMVKSVRGTMRVSSQPGKGTRFQLQLPLTLSVVRALLVEIGGEPFAFPLAYISRTLKLPKTSIETLEGRQHFALENRRIGLVTAHQILACSETNATNAEVAVVVLGDQVNSYGMVIDRFLGERELVIQKLDPRLGKIKDISAGSLMEDGSPVLIFDVDDLLRSIENLISDGRLSSVSREGLNGGLARKRKRVLVVDDSLTVRELERKFLSKHGYEVEIAVDGMDGWNTARTGHFDLVITDVDMPRLDGIELVTLIKKDANLHALPVMIVSYKDREEDRRRGLEAGADYYLTKGSFHDETLLQAVVDLIGEAHA